MAMTMRLVRSSCSSRTRALNFFLLHQQFNVITKASAAALSSPTPSLQECVPMIIPNSCPEAALTSRNPSLKECIPVINPLDLKPNAFKAMAKYEGGLRLVANAHSDDCIRDIAKFALEEMSRRKETYLELVGVLGAWVRPVFSRKYDITLEATAPHCKKKFYRVSVCIVADHKIVDLVQWEATQCPHPVSYFEPATYQRYARRLKCLEEEAHYTPKISRHQKAVLRWFKMDAVGDHDSYWEK